VDIRRWFKPKPEKAHEYNLDEKGYAMGKGLSLHPEDLKEVAEALWTAKTEHEDGLYD
jgi:hypothetical protein